MALDTDIKIFQISPSFAFCHGEIGKSEFKSFIELVTPLDLVYAALPKPENFSLWYKLANRAKISHKQFFSGLCHIWKELNAPEYHIEVGPRVINNRFWIFFPLGRNFRIFMSVIYIIRLP